MPDTYSRKIVAYQDRDASAFDYKIYFIDDFRMGLRGPRVPVHLHPSHAVAIGSAGVFGRFIDQPFCEQLTLCGIPTVNLGVSGARPQMYQMPHAVARMIGKADLVIAEFMSARGYGTRFFEPTNAWSNMGTYVAPDGARTEGVFVDRAWTLALGAYPAELLNEEVIRSRGLYVADFCRVIEQVRGKIIFLWISQRPADYTPTTDSFIAFSGWFPHFVNKATRDRIVAYARERKGEKNVDLVEVVSAEGLPARLFDRHTGAPATFLSKGSEPSVNRYYPSQAMHDAAAIALRTAVERVGL